MLLIILVGFLGTVYAKQKQPGCKKCKANQKQQCYKVTKNSEGQEVEHFIKNPFTCIIYNSLQDIFTTKIGFVTWPPL